jgi:hypothetical protein
MMPSILRSAPVPPAAKHPHNMMLPLMCFTFGMVFFGLAKQFYISFIRPEDISPKSTIFVPMCSCKTVVWLFYGGF